MILRNFQFFKGKQVVIVIQEIAIFAIPQLLRVVFVYHQVQHSAQLIVHPGQVIKNTIIIKLIKEIIISVNIITSHRIIQIIITFINQ